MTQGRPYPLPSKWWLLLPSFMLFAFYFPRFLDQHLGPENPWTSFFYLYGFGSLYMGSGLLLILQTKACRWSRPRDRFWFKIIPMGFFYFASLHALWIYLSISIPFLGAP